MTQTATKQQPETALVPVAGEVSLPEIPLEDSRDRQAEQLRLLWGRRRFFFRAGVTGLLISTLVAFLIPKSYTSTTQLMPPDQQSTSGMAMMAAMAAKTGGGLAGVAGDLLGLKSSGALFIGVLRSESSEDRLIQQFDLKKVYGKQLTVDARIKLDENTSISEDRKSGIITISVTDHSPQRAAALANAYVDQLNTLVSELSTSSAHRERVFLEDRLKVAKVDLDDAVNQLAQFSSKNNTLDIQQEGKAMLDAAGTIAGELIAAQSQLEGLRQIYTDSNSRVRALNGRVAELRRQLQKLSGTQGGNEENISQASALTKNQAGDPPVSQAADPSTAKAGGGLPFPTIKSLPLLGAKYGDYYRRAKIQETVFELLTQQYELAKVQEAKETPSVKVLDLAKIPEKKSFPPRLTIVFLGTFLALALSVVWVMGSAQWEATDPLDPRRVLLHEVAGTLKARIPWALSNGVSSNGAGSRADREAAGRAEEDFQRDSDLNDK
ncbi:MAG TPA: Wzz/FepE/Etk N-terminal domain-containing protein [Candidatus Sulfotelmatobacter sp.]|nr:Wzz/FepE/Etk N-terminal domain-containing protein [Candidatus Sulfotelmatobacter sp.]